MLFKAEGAGLMLVGEGEVLRWVTATGPRAQTLEAVQERLGEGPCLEAFHQGVLQQVTDNAVEERWGPTWPRCCAMTASTPC